MKKVFTILMVLCVLLGMSGCSTMKTYKTEDYEVYDIIAELDELKEEVEEDENVAFDYKLIRGIDGKYTIKINIEFYGHTSEWKTRAFELDELRNGFDGYEIDDIFTFKVDGKKYDYDTCMVLFEHYTDVAVSD